MYNSILKPKAFILHKLPLVNLVLVILVKLLHFSVVLSFINGQ